MNLHKTVTDQQLTALMPWQSFKRLPTFNIDLVRPPNSTSRVPEQNSTKLNIKKSTAYGSRSHIMTISSSLPLASHLPLCAQRTVRTGPVCIVSVHSDLGGLLESSDVGFSIGLVLHMRILASSPPVAIREPSGCT